MSPARAARLAVVGGLAVFGVKLLSYALTGSVGLLSDALESTVNVAAAGLTALAVALSARPPDKSHPYGHDKAEYLSSVAEGLLVGVAAVLVAVAARERFLEPRPIEAPLAGLLVAGVASALNLALGRHLVAVGRASGSVALVADGRHVLADVWGSAGVLLGVGLAAATGAPWLDPLVAAAVAVGLLATGVGLVRRSVGGLMDEALPPIEVEAVGQAIAAHQDRYLEVHDLRTRGSGGRRFVDFHLVLPGGSSVSAAHDLCDEIETAIEAALPEVSVTIHVEPAERRGEGTDLRF